MYFLFTSPVGHAYKHTFVSVDGHTIVANMPAKTQVICTNQKREALFVRGPAYLDS